MSNVEIKEPLTSKLVQEEIDIYVKDQEKRRKQIRSFLIFGSLIAVAILVAVLMLPVLRIYGTTMAPTLNKGDIVVSMKASDVDKGDLISFYYNNNILVKRVIACEGDWVDIDQEGNVFINGDLLDEPYVQEKAFGKCDIVLPYRVPEGSYFVMGDHRNTSTDSRSRGIGAINSEKVVGKIAVRLWPLTKFGKLE